MTANDSGPRRDRQFIESELAEEMFHWGYGSAQ